MSYFDLRQQGNVLVLTMTNGDNANTFTEEVVKEWHKVLDEVSAYKGNAALLIHSNSDKYWSTGINLEWIQQQPREYFLTFAGMLDGLFLRLALLDMPTVGCLTGHTFAGAAIMAAALDFRIMNSEKGWFCYSEVDVKIPFSTTMHAVISQLATPPVLRSLALTGRKVSGKEAEALGIVEAAWPAAELFDKSLAFAEMLGQKDRRTYASIKRGLKHHLVHLKVDKMVP